MGRPYFMGESVMTRGQRKNYGRIVFGSFAGLTGAVLLAAFVAPFYGALDRPVTVVGSGGDQSQADAGSSNGIVVEQFDYDEPDKATDGNNSASPETPAPENAPDTDEQPPATQNGQGALEREPARPPLSDMGLASTPQPPELPAPAVLVEEGEPMQLLQRPVAIAAGRLESQGRIVDLQGIEVTPVEQTCQSVSGENWPCGMLARTAFRQWLRARAILCRLPQNDSGAAIATQCSVGNDDPAMWLVANGWAKASAGSPYGEAGKKAEDAKIGFYGDKPDTSLPELNSTPSLPTVITPETSQQPVAPRQFDGEFPPVPNN